VPVDHDREHGLAHLHIGSSKEPVALAATVTALMTATLS